MCLGWLRKTNGMLSIAALAAVLACPAGAAVQTIALRGVSPAGDGATFHDFSLPSLNNRGQVAFGARLVGSEITLDNDTGYWIEDGEFRPVLREGAPAPGMPAGSMLAGVFSLFTGQVPLNDVGDIAVGMSATQMGSGLWVGNHESLALLAAQGNAAPGAENNAGFSSLAGVRATLNRNGDVAFSANLNSAPYTTINSTNYHDGTWILNRNGSVASTLAGSSLPEIGPDAQVFGFHTFTFPGLNRNGEAFTRGYYRVSPAASSVVSLFGDLSANGLDVGGYYGQPLPQLGPNATLGFSTPGGASSTGAIVAQASYSNPGGSPSSGSAIVVADESGVTVAAYSGGPAPGGAGHVFTGFSYEPTMNSRGELAFYGGESDGTTSRSGVWTGAPSDLRPVMLQGMAAPGTDATFGSFFRNTPSINRFGQIATPAILVEPGGANKQSLWATDLEGNPVMIARVGGSLEVAPGDVRTITAISMLTFHGDDDGKPRGLNDLGQVAFSATFGEGLSGIFLSNAVAHLPGDYNGDHTVNNADYVVWRKALATQDPVGDGDRDGVVDQDDYALWREFLGTTLPADAGLGAGAVPEPGAIVVGLAVAAMVLLVRRGRRM